MITAPGTIVTIAVVTGIVTVVIIGARAIADIGTTVVTIVTAANTVVAGDVTMDRVVATGIQPMVTTGADAIAVTAIDHIVA